MAKPSKNIASAENVSYDDMVKILKSIKGTSTTYIGKKEIGEVFRSKRLRTNIPTIDFLTSGGLSKGRITILAGNISSGKCLGKDTPIIMSDGRLELVQNIKVGDQIMGDDNTPRNVLSVTSGIDKLYRVRQSYGDDYIVNSAHILSVAKTSAPKTKPRSRGNKIDINVEEYLASTDWFKYNYRGYKSSFTMKEQHTPIDPYFIGLWLGDGNSHGARIYSDERDTSIRDYLVKLSSQYECQVISYKDKRAENAITYKLTTNDLKIKNKITLILKDLNLIGNKHIPDIYKYNSKENLLKLLAGMIDSDGYRDKRKNQFFISNKKLNIIEDLQYIGRSLGFKCVIYTKKINSETYYNLSIVGHGINEIPCLLPRKKADPVSSKKSYLASKLDIEYIGNGEYFGFEIDGNHRFLLGDCTVTHNTTSTLQIVAAAQKAFKEEGTRKMCLWYDVEGAYDVDRANQLGIDQDYMIVKRSKVIEDVFSEIDDLISTGFIGFLVIDSLDALIARKVDDSDYGNTMGGASGAVAMHLPKLFNKIMEHEVTTIFIKQARVKMGVMSAGEVLTFSGGKALRHFADSIFIMSRLSNKNLSYVPTKVKADKTRSSRMGLTLEMPMGENGMDQVRDLINLAIAHGLINQTGSWLNYKDEKYQGVDNFIKAMRNNVEEFAKIYNDVYENIISSNSVDISGLDGEITLEDTED